MIAAGSNSRAKRSVSAIRSFRESDRSILPSVEKLWQGGQGSDWIEAAHRQLQRCPHRSWLDAADVPLQNSYFGMVCGERADGVGPFLDGREHPIAHILEALSGTARACEEIESRKHEGIYIGTD